MLRKGRFFTKFHSSGNISSRVNPINLAGETVSGLYSKKLVLQQTHVSKQTTKKEPYAREANTRTKVMWMPPDWQQVTSQKSNCYYSRSHRAMNESALKKKKKKAFALFS